LRFKLSSTIGGLIHVDEHARFGWSHGREGFFLRGTLSLLLASSAMLFAKQAEILSRFLHGLPNFRSTQRPQRFSQWAQSYTKTISHAWQLAVRSRYTRIWDLAYWSQHIRLAFITNYIVQDFPSRHKRHCR